MHADRYRQDFVRYENDVGLEIGIMGRPKIEYFSEITFSGTFYKLSTVML